MNCFQISTIHISKLLTILLAKASIPLKAKKHPLSCPKSYQPLLLALFVLNMARITVSSCSGARGG